QLQVFEDKGQYWDAWNIAPDYQDHPLPAPVLESIEWVEQGPVRQRLRVIKQLGDSTIQQDYVLDACAQHLTVETEVDWQACQVVLKTAFPLNLETDQVTAGIPFGAISRPLNSPDPHQQANGRSPLGNGQISAMKPMGSACSPTTNMVSTPSPASCA
ncbi:MAG: hypothetical protein HC812_12070, partial [Leptolyngbya sp. RL_3_1]|nr:hypothetical protein [Leptolyngbya sp. RL_3_1]